jgi:hypothetical protein
MGVFIQKVRVGGGFVEKINGVNPNISFQEQKTT